MEILALSDIDQTNFPYSYVIPYVPRQGEQTLYSEINWFEQNCQRVKLYSLQLRELTLLVFSQILGKPWAKYYAKNAKNLIAKINFTNTLIDNVTSMEFSSLTFSHDWRLEDVALHFGEICAENESLTHSTVDALKKLLL